MSEELYWLGFSAFSGIGPLRFQKLLQFFGSAKDAWHASEKDITSVVGKAVTKKFVLFKTRFSLETNAKKLSDKKISFLFLKDTNYPQLLAKIPNAPFVLYCKGNVELVSNAKKTIGIVGTRKVTAYGQEVTKLVTQQLVDQGFCIVSGLALGVDAIAHTVALDTPQGETIAVLGCGVDCCSPSVNQPIYDKIIRNFGAVVSESAFGGAVSKGMFPARNRIIAGLSLGVLVTEGSEDSGSLITAQRAFQMHRPVFTIPGPITSTLSKGPLQLLQQGAHGVASAEDILTVLHLSARKARQHVKKLQADTPAEQEILDILAEEALHRDDIVRRSGKSTEVISSLLSLMEIKGLITNKSGKFSL